MSSALVRQRIGGDFATTTTTTGRKRPRPPPQHGNDPWSALLIIATGARHRLSRPLILLLLCAIIVLLHQEHLSLSWPFAGRTIAPQALRLHPRNTKLRLRKTKLNVHKQQERHQRQQEKWDELRANVTVTLSDLASVVPAHERVALSSSLPVVEQMHQRRPILDLLQHAHMQVEPDVLVQLPMWNDMAALYGATPVMFGLETCADFRRTVPVHHRFVGVAGQLNSGTNALTRYIQTNLQIRENNVLFGMPGSVPWFKHAWVGLRHVYQKGVPINHTQTLPVVIIRDPYFWAHSCCESPYEVMQWRKAATCPNFVQHDGATAGEMVRMQWGKWPRNFTSLAHVWSDWYREYLAADFPRLIIRFEDLLFHTPAVLEAIRNCVGATYRHDELLFVSRAVKEREYYNRFKLQGGMVAAMIRYGHDPRGTRRTRNMTQADMEYARQNFDHDLMQLFHYTPPA